jgi:hypothetical protein
MIPATSRYCPTDESFGADYTCLLLLVKKLEGSLPCSQQPATRLCPEPDNLVHTLHSICSGSVLAHFSYSEEKEGSL